MTSLGPNAGTAHITVKPSLRGWSQDVRRQMERESKNLPPLQLPAPDSRSTQRTGEKAGDDFAGGFDRMVRKRIQASLAALPKAEIGVASTEAEQRLKDLRGELDGLSKKRIGVDVDAQAALARLRELQLQLERLSAESVDINVKADTILASAQLAAVHREVAALDGADATVNVNTRGATAGITSLSGASSLLYTRLAAVAGLGALLLPVGAVLVSLGATLVATLAAAGGGIGFLLASVVGNIAPVIKAQSELKQKQEQAASAAEAYASAQQQVRSAAQGVASAETSAARAISDAQRAVADARRNAARSIEAAEDAVTAAQDRRRDAQDDLNDAIDAAREKLASYRSQLRQVALDESGAALSVTQAQEQLNEVLSDPTATQLQIDLARQALAEAQFNYDESTKRRKDLQKQAAEDRKAGVAGDQGVIDAKDRLADANRALADAEQRLGQARADAARSIADAERNLSRARADGARSVAQAREQLALAREAEARAATKYADAQAEVASRLAKLSGPAAVFVKALDRAKAAWGRFVKATGPASFGLAAKGLDLFTRLLPKFVPLVRRSARAVGTLMTDFGKFATGKEGRGFIRWLTRTAPGAIKTIGRVVGNIVVGIAGLIGALAQTDTGFLDLTRRFADFGRHAGENSAVRGFFEYAKKNAPIIADLLGAMAGVVSAFIKAFAPVGTIVLRGLVVFFKVEALYLRFLRWARPLARIAGLFIDLGQAAADGWALIARATTRAWKQVVEPVLGKIGDAFQGLWKRFIRPVFQAIEYQLEHTVFPVLRFLWEKVIKPVFGWIGDKIAGTWRDRIKPTLAAFRDFIRDDLVPAIKRGIDRIGQIWDGLKKAAGTPVKFVVDTVYNNGLRKVINAIPGVDNVDPVDTSGWPSFARGGVLPGWTPGRDVHRFVSPTAGVLNLSGGEGILIPQAVRQLGGAPGIGYLNRRARMGRLSLRPLLEQSHAAGGLVYVDGEPMSRVAAAQLAVAEHASGIPMRVMQGSYQAPSSYSGTSHTGGGVMDTSPGSFAAQAWLRKVAFAAWARNILGAASAGTGAHVHSVSLIDPAAAGNSQAAAYRAGGDGLGGSDYGPRPPVSAGLLAQVRQLAGAGSFYGTASGISSAVGGNPLTPFLKAIDAANAFAKAVPDMLSRLRGMGAWGKLLLGGVRSMGGQFRGWVNDKIPGPGPMPGVFDRGGLALGRGLLAKRTIAPERVLSPAQTAAFERQVATLDNWDRTARALAHVGGGAGLVPRLEVARFRIVDWDKGLAELEYMATAAAEQVLASHDSHGARIHDLDVDYS